MPYLRNWNASLPLGSRDAGEVDDAMREIKFDLEQRFNTVLGADGDMTDDPVIPAGYDLTTLRTDIDAGEAALVAAIGPVASVERTIPWFAGRISGVTGSAPIESVTAVGPDTLAASAFNIWIPVVIPVGVTITTMRIRVVVGHVSHVVTAAFHAISAGSNISITSLAAPSGGWMTAAAPSLLTVADRAYGFVVAMDNAGNTGNVTRLYEAQVKYTHPGGTVR